MSPPPCVRSRRVRRLRQRPVYDHIQCRGNCRVDICKSFHAKRIEITKRTFVKKLSAYFGLLSVLDLLSASKRLVLAGDDHKGDGLFSKQISNVDVHFSAHWTRLNIRSEIWEGWKLEKIRWNCCLAYKHFSQVTWPFLHWTIGGSEIREQTGHSRLLFKSSGRVKKLDCAAWADVWTGRKKISWK